MLRLLIIAPLLILVPALSADVFSATTARLSISASDETQVSFHVDFGGSKPLSASLSSANSLKSLSATLIPIDDTTSIQAQIACFLIPAGGRARLISSSLTLGTESDSSFSNKTIPDTLLQIRLSKPVWVRGMLLGKVIIPRRAKLGATWREVTGADIAIGFEGSNVNRFPPVSGRLDKLITDLAINGDVAQTWRNKSAAATQGETYDPFAQSPNWVRIAVKSRGVYNINRTDLIAANVNVSSLDPRSFRLFHAGGKPLSNLNSIARDSLVEIAIAVQGEEDGIFSGDDFIMFYANGSDFWDWSDSLNYIHHPYSDRNVFYLTYGGSFTGQPKRMSKVDGQPNSTIDTLSDSVDPFHFEEEHILSGVGEIDDYFHWYWSGDTNVVTFLNLPESPKPVNHDFRVRVIANGLSATLNGVSVSADSSRGRFSYFHSNQFVAGTNTLVLHLAPIVRYYYGSNGIDSILTGLTDFVEINLRRDLSLPSTGELYFSAPNNSGRHNYVVAVQNASTHLLDITDLKNQRIITGEIGANVLRFASESTPSSGRVFALVNDAAMIKPFSIVSTQIDDIIATTNGADLIIVTHDNFYSQALDFAAHRRNQDAIRVRVVRVSDIYAQFSGGLVDPVAIRDFLGYSFQNWSGARPSYCLLAGDGVYDFRNNLRTGAVNYIPPFVVENDSTVSDENYAYFGKLFDLDSDDSYPADRGVDMVIARWPVKTSAEFRVVADKMVRYETAANAGPWQNLITLVADDQNHPHSEPEIQHTMDSENLASQSVPPLFNLNKIYGIEYPYGTAGEKPEQREAIIRAINRGTLLVNYVGHGNPDVWADEHIFRRVEDIPRLKNPDHLPLIFNASCSIGFFDDPLSEGMAEELLRSPNGGAIGTVSATRLVFSRPNSDFNQEAFAQLFSDKGYTISEAVFVAKLLRQGISGTDENDRKYIYIGDPLTRLAVAPLKINFVKFQPDSFVALTVTELDGEIVDAANQVQNGFSGSITVSALDNERTRKFQFGPYLSVSYKQYGPEIYRGKVDVANGRFTIKFVVPKDVSYGGREARISSFALSGSSGAAGYIAPIAIGNINKTVVDSIGPGMAIYFLDDPGRSDHAEIPQDALLTVELFDSLGINLSGDIGHGIELVIDDRRDFTYELTDSFAYNPGSYQRGKSSIKLPSIAPGEHRLRVKAWDSANNSSQKEISCTITSATGLEISQLLCYPNPVSKDCQFSYILSDDASDVILKIFTLSGIEIFSLGNLPESSGYHSDVRWYLRDDDGDVIANGVYLFQLSARSGGNRNDNRAVATGKLVVMK